MRFCPSLEQLIIALKCLPGVGPKSAQRLAFHLLERDKPGAKAIIHSLTKALDNIRPCESCGMLTDTRLCSICSDTKRNTQQVCIVETPADVLALESMGDFRGVYRVLGGHLSPLDGIGPDTLNLPRLLNQLQTPDVTEVILATNATVEGEATAHYLAERIKPKGITVSRLAHGVPVGGELTFVDQGTLSQAFQGRVPV